MLFNSYTFIFAYIPLAFCIAYAIAAWRRGGAVWAVFLLSLVFYAWWSVAYTPLLLLSILFNYTIGRTILARRESNPPAGRAWLAVGVAGNLAVLGYFKYANFLADTLSGLTGHSFRHVAVILPLGISFFTFTQIAFLVDASEGGVRKLQFPSYGLFVTYFPHLIAGPILHHRPMMSQFRSASAFGLSATSLSVGFAYFIFGLAKKTLIADRIAPYANAIFDAAKDGTVLTLLEAWGGALAYTAQLYFDFSGYSDMAIGLGLMMGITLPINFNSPYQATSIAEFWRRWHVTLSRFLRDYLYFRLGGNRRGVIRRYLNLLITMLLGGLWHGASWTFVAWGGLHGLYLVVNHFYRALAARYERDPLGLSTAPGRLAGWLITMAAVVFAWVLFRAESFSTAWSIMQSMIGMHGLNLPAVLRGPLDMLSGHVAFGNAFANGIVHDWPRAWLLIAGALAVAALAPNSQYLFRDYLQVEREYERCPGPVAALHGAKWCASVVWLVLLAAAFVACVFAMTGTSTFLYFQF